MHTILLSYFNAYVQIFSKEIAAQSIRTIYVHFFSHDEYMSPCDLGDADPAVASLGGAPPAPILRLGEGAAAGPESNGGAPDHETPAGPWLSPHSSAAMASGSIL